MLPSGSQNSAQVNSVNQYRVANYGTFLLSSPKVVTGEKAWVVKVKTGVDMVSSGKGAEHDRAVPIYEEAKYEILELNSRITFQILVSALEDSMRLPIREISQIEFTPDRAYPIVTWHSHKSGPQASNVPATEINDEFYKQLFGDWNVHYNKMATVGSEFALRIIQLLLDREKPMTLKGELTSRVINFGKDAIDESDITDIALQVDKNGYHRILVTVAGEGTFVVERSHAEQVLRQAIAANKLDSKYLNTDSYLPMNLMSGDLHGFNLKLSVSGVDSKLQIQSAEKRYLNLERNSAEKLLEYREGLRGLYQSMLELDDISTVMRAVLGLSVPDEILGSIDLLNAVRSDKGLLTSDFIVARLEDIKSGRMTFKEFFQLIDEQGKESARGFVDGLAKLRASDPKYGASRFRQAKEALDAYLKSLEGN
ncbi:MAG: hypothetical protein KDD56_08495, partial [Bdellovibrionales bacterium]|nr:hypothetical protein [Bdellovibrionales bacterium]